MSQSVFKLESLLETHEQPFVVIGPDLHVLAVNQAWETVFGLARENFIGQPCCNQQGACRHQRMFQTLEPYAGIFTGDEQATKMLLNVRGFPLLTADGRVYLGESQSLLVKPGSDDDQPGLIGKSDAFIGLKTKLQQAAVTPAPVLLLGETGTGKELAAEFIHRHSQYAHGEFVIADCTVFGEDLFESELFGHEKGAFTGAASNKKGLFELADNGTLFLDEIGELPFSQQAKLLRALESGQFRRVGGTATLNASVRVVCATHRNLAEMVRLGRFREDLFYRLSVFPINIPPLRERKQDVPVLVDHFLRQLSLIRGGQLTIGRSALIKLMQHNWPGNIRELRNCLQLASGLCHGNTIQEADIHFMRGAADSMDTVIPDRVEAEPVEQPQQSMTMLEQYEANFIAGLIKKYQGNRKLIAAEMNISERTLYRKLNRLNLN
ncbi:sigma 54-interacting transcriptional regulator [Methylomonas sp. LL1]|uniref:sigma-54 interaction domain-containing protein n=1 Tax=Methylomonas sp. LL1 TaxID=2785785 RepID=UPI0018C40CB3|nr:sigma 54-interacting transcriptional regulator [Methylomonas sp. LL1]QPK63484.1 sigma 54-interacting transcriptional regulator [Methylomonas sp. LL1]CAG1021696.1 Nif-specific regulatory protein [Methylococcales bacterium]